MFTLPLHRLRVLVLVANIHRLAVLRLPPLPGRVPTTNIVPVPTPLFSMPPHNRRVLVLPATTPILPVVPHRVITMLALTKNIALALVLPMFMPPPLPVVVIVLLAIFLTPQVIRYGLYVASALLGLPKSTLTFRRLG